MANEHLDPWEIDSTGQPLVVPAPDVAPLGDRDPWETDANSIRAASPASAYANRPLTELFGSGASQDEVARAIFGTPQYEQQQESVLRQEARKGVPFLGAVYPTTPEMAAYEKEHPIGSQAVQFAGGAAAMAPLGGVGAGVGLKPLAKSAALTGGITGGDVAAREYADTGKVDPASVAIATGLGGAIGGGVSQGLGYWGGKAASAIADAGGWAGNTLRLLAGGAPTAPVLSGRDPMAVNRLARAAQASRLTPQMIDQRLAELGPEGTVADLAPEFGSLAGTTARMPGEGAGIIYDAYNIRADEARGRIENAVTQTMGPRRNLRADLDARNAARDAAADPLYKAFRDTPIEPSPAIDALMTRLKYTGAINDAGNKMGISGEPTVNNFFVTNPLTGEMELQPKAVFTPQFFDYMKRSLDDKIGAAYNAGTPGKARELLGLKRDMVNTIDKVSPVWAQAREAWGTPEGITNAVNEGQQLFTRGTRPDDFAEDIKELSGPEASAMLEGARDAAASTMDATYRGHFNEVNMFQAKANQDKLRTLMQRVYGPDEGSARTDALTRAVNAEKDFSEGRSKIIGGSDSARWLATAKTLETPESWLNQLGHEYLPHVTLDMPIKATGLGQRAQEGAEARGEQARAALAPMLMAKGADAGTIAKAALQHVPPGSYVGPSFQRYVDMLSRNIPPTMFRPHLTVTPNNQGQQ
jgi:hypothetical protein